MDAAPKKPDQRTLILFDVDGTLTEHQRPINPNIVAVLKSLHQSMPTVDLGIVSGSDVGKILTQFQQPSVDHLLECGCFQSGETMSTAREVRAGMNGFLSFVFAENGLVAYSSQNSLKYTLNKSASNGKAQMDDVKGQMDDVKGQMDDVRGQMDDVRGQEGPSGGIPTGGNDGLGRSAAAAVKLCCKSLLEYLGEDRYQKLVNYILLKFGEIRIPRKRSNMIELRNGVLNISPIGRNCSIEEREEFYAYDQKNKIREKLCDDLSQEFHLDNLQFSRGGQISIDIYPTGWDKTFCLSLLDLNAYQDIYFFGDRCVPGGNDYSIYNDPRVTRRFAVSGPEDTIAKLSSLFNNEKQKQANTQLE